MENLIAHRELLPSENGEDPEDVPKFIIETCPFIEVREWDAVGQQGQLAAARSRQIRSQWRVKDRTKTFHVALVLCLNLGVDPPDVHKPDNCARTECWVDTKQCRKAGGAVNAGNARLRDKIGEELTRQYQRWQPRARYRLCLDPVAETIKKTCSTLRKAAKEERVLFHYNGHGVPKPTENGEIWVFNKEYTQYIPLSIYDLQAYMGAPSVYVWDCNCAGLVVDSFLRFADDQMKEWMHNFETQHVIRAQASGVAQLNNCKTRPAAGSVTVKDYQTLCDLACQYKLAKPYNFSSCIHLAACQSGELLPTAPEIPADLFTSCLTSPIKTAFLFYLIKNNLTEKIPVDVIDRLPGVFTDRRTIIGEITWIFTAVTDTIAWNALPKHLFQKLFRQDLLIAALFRNFLLAERVMRAYNCQPVSWPQLPHTHEHALWRCWDYALDLCVHQVQLPHYATNSFFAHHLAAFQVWLQMGSASGLAASQQRYNNFLESDGQLMDPAQPFGSVNARMSPPETDVSNTDIVSRYEFGEENSPFSAPQLLPIILQVLLSQTHRVNALELLRHFLDLGANAVHLVLAVGIQAYVIKLLQSSVVELQPLLTFVWAKILAVDPEFQSDLVKDSTCSSLDGDASHSSQGAQSKVSGHEYFLNMLDDNRYSAHAKILPAFVIAALVDGYRPAQRAVLERAAASTKNYMTMASELLVESRCARLRLWLLIGLGRLWDEYNEARWQAIRALVHEQVLERCNDAWPMVRAAAVFALGRLVANRSENNEHATQVTHAICLRLARDCVLDSSPVVRQQLIVALQWIVLDFEDQFVTFVNLLKRECELVNGAVEESPPGSLDRKYSMGKRLSRLESGMHANLPQAAALIGAASNSQTVAAMAPIKPRPSIVDLFRGMTVSRQAAPEPSSTEPVAGTSSQLDNGQQPRLVPSRSLFSLARTQQPTADRHVSDDKYDDQDADSGERLDDLDILEERMSDCKNAARTAFNTVYATVWRALLQMVHDPCPTVQAKASTIVDYVESRVDLIDEQIDRSALMLDQVLGSRVAISTVNVSALRSADPPLFGTPPAMSSSHGAGREGTPGTDSRGRRNSDTATRHFTGSGTAPRATFMVGSPDTGLTQPAGGHGEARFDAGTAGVLPVDSDDQAPPRRRPTSGRHGGAIGPPKVAPTWSPYTTRYAKRRGLHDAGPDGTVPTAPAAASGAAGLGAGAVPTIAGDRRGQKKASAGGAETQRRCKPLVECDFAQRHTHWIAGPIIPVVDGECRSQPTVRRQVSDAACAIMDAQAALGKRERGLVVGRLAELERELFVARHDFGRVAHLSFARLRQYLICASGDLISVYDWSEQRVAAAGSSLVASYSNRPPMARSTQTSRDPPQVAERAVWRRRARADPCAYVECVNESTECLVLTCSRTAVVRLWDAGLALRDSYSDIDTDKVHSLVHSDSGFVGKQQNVANCRLVTAWRMFSSSSTRCRDAMVDSGVFLPPYTFHWDQAAALLCTVGGNLEHVVLWDAQSERERSRLPMGGAALDSLGTAVSSDVSAAHMVVAGCVDGSVRQFDVRLPPADCRVFTWRHMSAPVSAVHVSPAAGRVVACDANANVRVWEPRMFQFLHTQDPVSMFNVVPKHKRNLAQGLVPQFSAASLDDYSQYPVRCARVHKSGELLAASIAGDGIYTYDVFGRRCGHVAYHEGVMGVRVADASAIAWHPTLLNVGAAGVDSHLSVFGVNH